MPCSLCVLTERAACLPRQVYLLSTDHGDILATVERIGNDFDGISRCASVPPRSHEACWLKAHNRSLPVCRHPRRLVRVTDILRLSIRTTGSRRGRRLDVAMLVAAPGCVAMPCLCIGTEAATGENSFDACVFVWTLSAQAVRTIIKLKACACEALRPSCAHLLVSRAMRLVWCVFIDSESVKRRNLSVLSSVESYSFIF